MKLKEKNKEYIKEVKRLAIRRIILQTVVALCFVILFLIIWGMFR